MVSVMAMSARMSSPNERKVIESCRSVLDYLNRQKVLLNGYSYGSDFLLTDPVASDELFSMILRQHIRMYGKSFSLSKSEVLRTYVAQRKGNDQDLKNKVPIKAEKTRTLFGEPDEERVYGIVYSYIGSNQVLQKRVLKIGYTSGNLCAYLAKLERAYRPRLLGSIPGTIETETAEKQRWSMYLAEGKEWFWPVEVIIEHLKCEWKIDANFDAHLKTMSPLPW